MTRDTMATRNKTSLLYIFGTKVSRFLIFLFLTPFIRFIVSFIYLFLVQKFFISPSLFVGFCFACDDTLASSSSWTEDSFEINVLLEPEPFSAAEVALSNCRAQNAAIEEELFSRIRGLEAQPAYGLPPQLNDGDYERLVRENLANSCSINHYRISLSNELFELKIMDLKSKLQDRLFHSLVAEPRIDLI